MAEAAVQALAMPMLHVYRNILRTAKYFPSRKRDKMIIAIKEEFREKRGLPEGVALAHAREVAERGLSDLRGYMPQHNEDGSIDVTLKGATQ
mmetsp:Transcript_12716/g.22484  ORF Transcript_12716/g.22484 Transcript_12716/m.22484 type:complete len:92 (+) Transcript_12716:143-418(+)|eukprot:CAMPEP_0119108642 /NCGR_PEP_ID=MMETSP1180-20130426/15577_1 /TAXON_ID=3052 ORGANISM="Chlamydomonas cf sp, Strain CCMP681" /NCGR_SAMPLE_ID=MMETSP1180 /ASSEMBLY_ACC=CAM_ASM_000741 /LENGTH=91 /DNA_ID=CAMNT_0007094279 /DNA_START=143 /DNA_END=418 /DNA_ORIENTATION=+